MKIKNLTDILFVKNIKCIYCNEELNTDKKYCMCDNCFANLPFNDGKICRICGRKIYGDMDICKECIKDKPNYLVGRSVFIYDGMARSLVSRLKFYHGKYLGEYLSKFIFDKYLELGWKCDIVLPVPMYKSKLKERGYNQAVELCRSFEGVIPIRTDILVKIKNTKNQAKSTFEERKVNLLDCFAIENSLDIKGKNILLVDDVITTGNTLRECCRMLNKNGVKKIYILTLSSVDVFKDIEKIGYE